MRVLTVVVLLATSTACEPAPEARPAPEPSAVAASSSAQIRFHPARPLHELPDSVRARAEVAREQAIGIVTPVYGDSAPRELAVLNDTAREVQTVARLRFYPHTDGGWTDTLWSREAGLFHELMRATHEDYGLPVVAKRGNWLRVHYGYGTDGAGRPGWVRLETGQTVYHDRDQQMFEFSTSLADPESTSFFARAGGQRVQVDLRPSHMLEVLRIDGDWIQVALLRPDTTPCTGDPQLKVQRSDTVWVSRYNAQGKRQLHSAVAGC